MANSPELGHFKKTGIALSLSAAEVFTGAGIAQAQENPSQSPAPEATPIFSFKDIADVNPKDGNLTFGEIIIAIPTYAEILAQRAQELATETQKQNNAQSSQAEKINPEDLSINIILDGKFKKISKDQYKKIVEKIAPTLSNYYIESGIDPYSNEKYVVEDYMMQYNQLKQNFSYHASGNTLASNIANKVKRAQEAADAGNFKLAKAFMDNAIADYRTGITILKTNELKKTFEKSVFDKDIEKQAKKRKVD